MRFGLPLIICLLILGGCNGAKTGVETASSPTPTASPTPAAASGENGKVVMALFDLSQSTQNSAMRQKYYESFQRILEKVGGGDILVADLITDDPLSQSSFPINETLAAFDPGTDNELLVRKKRGAFDKQLKEQRERLAAQVQTLLNDQNRKINKTRILDAMRLAERVFKTYQRPKKVLVIFSDMIEDSDRRNFQTQPPGEADITQLLDREKKAGTWPDLTGVKVYVIGAAGSQGSSAAYTAIENFWLQYFKQTGADLVKERYGAALLAFNE
jgi:hypothetical protein